MTRWEIDEAIYDIIGKVDNDEADEEDLEFLENLKNDLINMFKNARNAGRLVCAL